MPQTLNIELRPIDQIKPYPGNPRDNDSAVDAVIASLKEFGWRQPIVVDTEGVIIVGHTRFKAAERMGLKQVPVHVATDLTPAQVKAYRIADNATNEIASWNYDMLPIELAGLKEMEFDLGLLGFDQEELARIMSGDVQQGQTDPDDIPAPPDAATTQPGDIWVLGNHRLMCGDSSKSEDVDRLLGGASIHLVNTDPPYNVNVEPRSNNGLASGGDGLPNPRQKLQLKGRNAPVTKMRPKDRPLMNDFKEDSDFYAMMGKVFANFANALEPGRSFYIWGAGFPAYTTQKANSEIFPDMLRQAGMAYAHLLIWNKGYGVVGRKDFMTQYEVCFYGWKEGAGHKFYGPNNITDVWDVKKVNQQKMVHLTEKPVELAVRAMQYSSLVGENVLDLFGGSGSTMIAAEQTGRKAFLMELDPLYCDVICERWCKFTGKEAQRVAAGMDMPQKTPAELAGVGEAEGK